MRTQRILVSCFEPFGGRETNASASAVRALPEKLGTARLFSCTLPVVFGECAKVLFERAAECRPHVIVCVGEAGGRTALTPERFAVNRMDARIPDNSGSRPRGKAILPGGPAKLATLLPAEAMAEAILQAGYPAEVSDSAGTFVCNDLFYRLLAHRFTPDIPRGFLHVPAEPPEGTDLTHALLAALSVLTEKPGSGR
ncbi:MAG: pyroglutamyl-peptidase I [Clostridia bacterium]|nr:pyroglutamyl-peptidase I [Clostridia bacterium]